MNSTGLLCAAEPYEFWLRVGRVERGMGGGERKGWQQNNGPRVCHLEGCPKCCLATEPSVTLLPSHVEVYICLNVNAWESKYSCPFLSTWTNQSGSLSMEDKAVLLGIVQDLPASHQCSHIFPKDNNSTLSWGVRKRLNLSERLWQDIHRAKAFLNTREQIKRQKDMCCKADARISQLEGTFKVNQSPSRFLLNLPTKSNHLKEESSYHAWLLAWNILLPLFNKLKKYLQ